MISGKQLENKVCWGEERTNKNLIEKEPIMTKLDRQLYWYSNITRMENSKESDRDLERK